MTTDPRSRILHLVAGVFGLLGVACASQDFGSRGGLSREVVEKYPPDVAAAYEVFAHKCSRCHTLARPLTAPIYEFSHWQAYVTRMRRQSASGISETDAEKILVFLKYYAAEKKRAASRDEPPAPPPTPSPAEGGAT